MNTTITCSMCGAQFAPQEAKSSCPSCPLQKGCQLICCPSCGYETVDPGRSVLARLAQRFLERNTNEETRSMA